MTSINVLLHCILYIQEERTKNETDFRRICTSYHFGLIFSINCIGGCFSTVSNNGCSLIKKKEGSLSSGNPRTQNAEVGRSGI
jgi:hypothetical protein